MRGARVTLIRTSKMIQIRNVPDELHRTLKVRAAKAVITLSDYLLSEIKKAAEKPTMCEWLKRVRSREPVELDAPLVTMDARLARVSGIHAVVEVYG